MYYDLSGSGVFGNSKYSGFDFGFNILAVERPDGEYFEDGVELEDSCFEEVIEFGRMQKHIGDFG